MRNLQCIPTPILFWRATATPGDLMHAAQLFLTASLAFPNATREAVVWDGVNFDTDSFFDLGSPARLTVPAGLAGLYLIGAVSIWDINGSGKRIDEIRLNGTPFLAKDTRATVAGSYVGSTLAVLRELAVGDFVEVTHFQDSGSALNLQVDAELQNIFWILKVG